MYDVWCIPSHKLVWVFSGKHLSMRRPNSNDTPPPHSNGHSGALFSGAILPFYHFYHFYHFFYHFLWISAPNHPGKGLDPPSNQANAHLILANSSLKKCPKPPLSDIVFFRYTQYLTIFHLMQYYRDIFTIFFKCKLGQNAPKFHSWSAYVEIFVTKWRICWIFAHMLKFLRQNGAYVEFLQQNGASVEIFATKWRICWNFFDKMAHMLKFSWQNGAYVEFFHNCSFLFTLLVKSNFQSWWQATRLLMRNQ